MKILIIIIFLFHCSLSHPYHYKIVVSKAERKLSIFENDSLVKTYRIALGLSPVGLKEKRGDYKTPEGEYFISSKNAHSSFYLALGVSYPNLADAERGLKTGIISQSDFRRIRTATNEHGIPPQNTALGGDIFIHGNGTSSDWTWGCIAMENSDVKELFDEIPVGTPISIH